jgi:hypothetical protein
VTRDELHARLLEARAYELEISVMADTARIQLQDAVLAFYEGAGSSYAEIAGILHCHESNPGHLIRAARRRRNDHGAHTVGLNLT